MIIDCTGTVLTPGNCGRDCLGNGTSEEFECCCDECDYMRCCLETHNPARCLHCRDSQCPHSPNCED